MKNAAPAQHFYSQEAKFRENPARLHHFPTLGAIYSLPPWNCCIFAAILFSHTRVNEIAALLQYWPTRLRQSAYHGADCVKPRIGQPGWANPRQLLDRWRLLADRSCVTASTGTARRVIGDLEVRVSSLIRQPIFYLVVIEKQRV
ncbi:MAG: hypothetical protein E6230_23665 [Paenibacillus dendritiformis]|uniref:hypothetical protein n=1 Tax=uncultured Paenibacillus sp. TaxID=227322 RepID=UPI0025CB7B92|nr:hypothetical protein [uncultured Paenibacillus sp.]MDU5145178.1 hypothetical protein [Paenibacillus dendritiformis]